MRDAPVLRGRRPVPVESSQDPAQVDALRMSPSNFIFKSEKKMKILLPVDGSSVSLDAVRFAIRMARAGLHTSVVLANVQEAATLYELVVAHDPQVIEQVSAAAGAHTLEAAEALLKEAHIQIGRAHV